MNERIKQLAIRAGLDADLDLSLANQPLESFAELIIKECAMFGMVITDDHFDVGALYKHFGVEL